MKKTLLLIITATCLSCSKKESRQADISLPSSGSAVSNVPQPTQAADFSKTETALAQMFRKISDTDAQISENTPDLSRQFSDSLVSFVRNNEKTLQYPFELLQKEHVYVTTSDDGQFRVYSWDNGLGGTMRFFDQLFQFSTNGKTYAKESYASEDSQAFFSKIYTVLNKENQPVYLAISNSILSSKYVVQHITAYQFKDGSLNKTKVFKTKKELLSTIAVEFDFSSVADRPERPVEVISLNHNLLKIALVDKSSDVTKQNLLYEWDGSVFNYKGIN